VYLNAFNNAEEGNMTNMIRFTTADELLAVYYCVYLASCGLLITSLARILHDAGRTFLQDSFAGNQGLVRAVGRLLDIGFYLVSVGYVALTYQTIWGIPDLATALKIAIFKLGGLLLLLGVSHVMNLLVLAVLRERRRSSAQN
jgi:hypothetical protein